jgi:Spy/CpxP family protein refolding chaperone
MHIIIIEESPLRRILVAAALLFASATLAQQPPYAGQQERELKALSVEQVKQYLAGAGMGYAKAAELNHFPGPMHTLELADQLKLTAEQRASTKRLMDTHKVEARGLGAELVASERDLEQLFRGNKVDEAALARAVRTAAAVEGEYRLLHLETHRRMRALLTEEQVKRYDELRGYASGKPEQHRH